MIIDSDMIPKLIADLKIDRTIDDAYQILNLKGDGKWSIRLLLLSYLLKEKELQTITAFVNFGFSKAADDSLFQRFNFKSIRSKIGVPEKWFKDDIENEYITGVGNARSQVSKRPDLFVKHGSGYILNRVTGSRKLALVLFSFLLKAYQIDLGKVLEITAEDDASISREIFKQLFLLDSEGKPTSLYHEVYDIIETNPMLSQEATFDVDTKIILPHIQTSLMGLLQRHSHAFRKSPQKRKVMIDYDLIYSISPLSDKGQFAIGDLFDQSSKKEEHSESAIEEDDFESKSSPFILIGSAGYGKSFWMLQQALELWNESHTSEQAKTKRKRIPIFIELGSVFIDRTKRGEALVYGENKDLLWYFDDDSEEILSGTLISRSLEAMLRKSSQYVSKILDRIEWHKMEFLVFLDGWDELGSRERKEMINFIESFRNNQIPCIISSRTKDNNFNKLEPEYLELDNPSLDNCREYLQFRGMQDEVLDKIDEWFPNLTPLDLEILGTIPKMEEVSYGRVPTYRSWIELQVLSSVRVDAPHEIHSRSDIDSIIESELYQGKSLKEWIRNQDNPYSVWNYLPYIASLQRDGKNTSLSYDRVIQDNPLLKELLNRQYGSSDSPHPEISKNNLIPYLSAEYIFRKYLVGDYVSFRGDSQTFKFLLEILSYDSERSHHNESVDNIVELKPIEVASMICLEGESQSYSSKKKINHIIPNEKLRSTAFYTPLFDDLVRSWTRTTNHQIRGIILDSFSKMIQTIIIEEREDNPERYIIPLIEIEHKIENIDYSDLIIEETANTKDYEITDALGYTLYYLDSNKVENWLIENTKKKPWLAPWTVRVIKQENLQQIGDIIDKVHDEQVVYDVLRFVTSDFSSISDHWFRSLHHNSKRLKSAILWNSLAYSLHVENDDYRFSVFLEVVSCPLVLEKSKLELIYALNKVRLSQRYIREVWRSVEHGDIDSKFGVVIGLSQELPDINMDDIFDALEKNEGFGWLALLLPGILQEKYDEAAVNKRFVKLSFSIIQILRHIRVAPWDEGRLSTLVNLWWESNLKNTQDAINIVHSISKSEREDKLAELDYRETDVLERLVKWLKVTRKSNKKEFFRTLIESDIDMTDFLLQRYLYPLYEEIEDRTDLDDLLVERYPDPIRGLLRLPLSHESWIKHIDKVDFELILDWDDLMAIYLEAGKVKTINEAIEILDKIKTLGEHLIETFNPLSKWVLQRPMNDIATFTLCLLKKDLVSNRMGYWRRVAQSGLIEALTPISKNSPEVYNRILEIAMEIPLLTIDIRSELQFLFDQLLPEDKLRVIRPHIEKFLGKELFFFRTPLAELILIHGNKNDLEILIHSLNTEPWNLGDIWFKNIERSKQIFEKLSNPLAKLLYEIDISGGWDEYKKKLENDPKKAEQDLLLFLDNGRISVCYTYLTSGEVLRKTALKHWKRIFLSDETSKEVRNMYLGDLFDSENDEIVEYVAGEIDRIHQDIKEEEKDEERMHRTSYYSYQLRPFDKIRDRCGYEGFKKLLLKVKDPYAIEGVMTYLVGAAKKEGVPKSEIQSMKEYDKLGKETKWNIIKNYDE